jgi:toxin YhaV
MSAPKPPFDVRNGWRLYKLPAFEHQLADLTAQVEALRQNNPAEADHHPKSKLLKRILEVVLDEVPRDPTNKVYRQGTTLGAAYKDWSRAKFLGRFRLFFRFSSREKMIIYCWINDENTLRKAGAKTDPYAVFAAMLKAGDPPNDWDKLVKKALDESKPK